MSLMIADIAKKSGGGNRALPKAGVQAARLIHIVDLGLQARKPFQGQPKEPARALWFNFELVNDKFEYNGEQVNHRISPRDFTVSTSDKAGLTRFISSIDPSNMAKGDVSKLSNAQALVTVVHSKVEDKTYANFAGVSPVPEGFPVAEPSVRPVVFSFDNPVAADFVELPEFIQNKILAAVNYKGSKVEKLAPEIAKLKAEYVKPDKKATVKTTAPEDDDAPY